MSSEAKREVAAWATLKEHITGTGKFFALYDDGLYYDDQTEKSRIKAATAEKMCAKLGLQIPEPSTPAAKAGGGWIRCSDTDPDMVGWHGLCWVQFDDGTCDEKRPHQYVGNGNWRVDGALQHAPVIAWHRATCPAPPSPETNGG